MGIVSLDEDRFVFECPECKKTSKDPFIEIRISDVKINSGINGFVSIELPKCKCGSSVFMIPGTDGDGLVSHMRRCIFSIALKNNQIKEKANVESIDKYNELLCDLYKKNKNIDREDEFKGKKIARHDSRKK